MTAQHFANGVSIAAGSCVWFSSGNSKCFEASYHTPSVTMGQLGNRETAVAAVGQGVDICAELVGGKVTCLVNGRQQTISSGFDGLQLTYTLEDGEILVGMMPGLLKSTYGNVFPGLIVSDDAGQRVVTDANIPEWLDAITGDIVATLVVFCWQLRSYVTVIQ